MSPHTHACTSLNYKVKCVDIIIEWSGMLHCKLPFLQDGSVRCSQKTCPDVTCQNPVTEDCCPVCTDCLYRGRTLRNGQSIPGDACQTCTCQVHLYCPLLIRVKNKGYWNNIDCTCTCIWLSWVLGLGYQSRKILQNYVSQV